MKKDNYLKIRRFFLRTGVNVRPAIKKTEYTEKPKTLRIFHVV